MQAARNVNARRSSPSGANAADNEIATSAGAEGTRKRLCASPDATLLAGGGNKLSSAGNPQLCIRIGGHSAAEVDHDGARAPRLHAVPDRKSGRPGKKRESDSIEALLIHRFNYRRFARRFRQSAGDEFLVEQADSMAGKFDSSRRTFNSLPSRDDAPAMATRTAGRVCWAASRGEVMSWRDAIPGDDEPCARREASGRWRQRWSQSTSVPLPNSKRSSQTNRPIRTMSSDGRRRAIGISLKLRYRTVLDIRAASPTTINIQNTDQRQSSIGDLDRMHRRGDESRGRRTRQAHEITRPASRRHSLDIEARQPPGAANHKRKRHPPADLVQAPDVQKLGFRNARARPR